MSYNLARPYSRSFKGPIDKSLVFETTAVRNGWLTTPEGIAIGYTGMIVSDLETNKAYILNSSNQWQELASSELATSSVSGLVKLFSDTTQTQVAQTVSSDANKTYGIQSNGSNQLVVNVPWTDTIYTHPTQTAADITESAGKVLSAIAVNTLGHVTSVGTKTLAEVDIPTLAQSKITNLTTDLGNKLNKSGGTMTGFIILHSNPTDTFHAATKGYVDAVKQGLDIKDSVRVATVDAFLDVDSQGTTLFSSDNVVLPNVDGVSLNVGDRILVKNQLELNGIYSVVELGEDGQFGWELHRTEDADSSAKVTAGMFVFVTEGNTNADTGWVLTTNDTIDLNATLLSFSQFSAAGQIYDGSGLIKSGNTISVGAGDGISVSADSVAVNSTVLRTSGVQTVTGDKDFGNKFLIKPTKNASSAFFPAFAVEPSESSQRLTYMTKSELVTALSFETPELGNSFVNTTGNQSISGIKTFLYRSNFNGGTSLSPEVIGNKFQQVGAINLFNDYGNLISYNASGTSNAPVNGFLVGAGTKLVLYPSDNQNVPPVAIGVGTNKIWNVVPASTWNYEWHAGSNKIATLYGNGTFNATNISGTNFYLGGSQITASASEINLLASASDKDILIGSGSDFVKQNLITALSGAIISQSGLSITNDSSNLIINHHLSPAVDTSNSNPNVIQNILIDSYGHITGVSNVNLDNVYLTSSDLNTQISFVSGIGSYYDSSTSVLTVFHSGGSKDAGVYGGNGIKSIELDSYGHIYDISTETYVASGNLCAAISDCTIDGGTY